MPTLEQFHQNELDLNAQQLQGQNSQSAESPPVFPCPEPEYIRDRSIKFVGDWTGDGYGAAERMLEESPVQFCRLLEQAVQDAETTSSPLAPLANAVRTEFKAMMGSSIKEVL